MANTETTVRNHRNTHYAGRIEAAAIICDLDLPPRWSGCVVMLQSGSQAATFHRIPLTRLWFISLWAAASAVGGLAFEAVAR
jgi:hypothetical protein